MPPRGDDAIPAAVLDLVLDDDTDSTTSSTSSCDAVQKQKQKQSHWAGHRRNPLEVKDKLKMDTLRALIPKE
jgi:hypothetical protein